MIDNARGDICGYYGGTKPVKDLDPTEVGKQAQIDDHLHDEDDFDDDGDDWLDQECGLAADGQCAMAGTEHCDFTCPHRDSEDFAGSEAWNKKHAARPRPFREGRR